MAHQDITATIKAELRFTMGNNNAENVLHVGYTGVPTEAMLDELETILHTWLGTDWADNASVDWSVQEIVLTDMNSLAGPRKAYPVSPAIPGTVNQQALPANATVAVKANIGIRGRGKSGRVFWIGLAESQVQGNTLDPTFGIVLPGLFDGLNTDIKANPIFTGLVIPHLQVNHGHPNPATTSPVVSFSLSDYSIDSQKNRLPFHKKRKR